MWVCGINLEELRGVWMCVECGVDVCVCACLCVAGVCLADLLGDSLAIRPGVASHVGQHERHEEQDREGEL